MGSSSSRTAKSFETGLTRQTKLFLSCVGLPQSFASFSEWSLMYYLQSFLTFDLSLPLSLPHWLALLFFNLLHADMRWYHLLSFIKYFVLAKCSRSTNHISYAEKMAYIRKPTGRGRYTEREREIAGSRRRSEKEKERPVTFTQHICRFLFFICSF